MSNDRAGCNVDLDSEIIKTSFALTVYLRTDWKNNKKYYETVIPNDITNALNFLKAEVDFSRVKMAAGKAIVKHVREEKALSNAKREKEYDESPCLVDFKWLASNLTPDYKCEITSKKSYMECRYNNRELNMHVTGGFKDSKGKVVNISANIRGKGNKGPLTYGFEIDYKRVKGAFKNMERIAALIREDVSNKIRYSDAQYVYEDTRVANYLAASVELGIDIPVRKDDLMYVTKLEERPSDSYYNGLRGVTFFRQVVRGVTTYEVKELMGKFTAEQMRKIVEIALWAEFSDDTYTNKYE